MRPIARLLAVVTLLGAVTTFGCGHPAAVDAKANATKAPQSKPDLSEKDLARVRAALETDGKIAAIKLYREITGAGLADSKIAVEALEKK